MPSRSARGGLRTNFRAVSLLFLRLFFHTASWPPGLPFPLAPSAARPPSPPTTMSSGERSGKAQQESRRESVAPSTTETLPAPPLAHQEKEKETRATLGGGEEQERKDFGFLPIPKRVRYDPERPTHFGLLMNVIFGIASTFSTWFRFLYASLSM